MLNILTEKYNLEWDRAWKLITQTFNYTNHTILPEALEKWPVPLMQRVLPLHMKKIFIINHLFMEHVKERLQNDPNLDYKLEKLSIIQEGEPKMVRMSSLCFLGSNKVNGVAELHTSILKSQIFKEYAQYFPEKLINKTNGVSPRRWIMCSNPELAALYTNYLGEQWHSNLQILKNLEKHKDEEDF